MFRILIAAIAMLIATPAFAHHHSKYHHPFHYRHHHGASSGRTHHHYHGYASLGSQRHIDGKYLDQDGGKHKLFMCAGCVIKETLAGVISISKENAEKFVGVINDLVKAGYEGPVDCASASHSHVPGSKHYSGNACDFDQCGWGCAPKIMHTAEAAAIIRKWGLTNGCSFSDCGHVSSGEGHALGKTHYASKEKPRHHYAARHHHTHYARA